MFINWKMKPSSENVPKGNCPVCNVTLVKYYIAKHIEAKHPEYRILCEQCPFTCTTNEELKKHMAQHKKSKSNQDLSNIIDCPICSKPVMKVYLNTHIQTIHPKSSTSRKFKCELCPFAAENFAAFTKHTSNHQHEDDKPKRIPRDTKCWMCGLVTNKYYLPKHMDHKHPVDKITCDRCEFSSDSFENMYNHKLLQHYDANISTCHQEKLPDNTEKMSKVTKAPIPKKLNTHEAASSNPSHNHHVEDEDEADDKPTPVQKNRDSKCWMCGLFTNKYYLPKHMDLKHPVDRITCDRCDFCSDSFVNMYNHKMWHHEERTLADCLQEKLPSKKGKRSEVTRIHTALDTSEADINDTFAVTTTNQITNPTIQRDALPESNLFQIGEQLYYRCKYCSGFFRNKTAIENHEKIHEITISNNSNFDSPSKTELLQRGMLSTNDMVNNNNRPDESCSTEALSNNQGENSDNNYAVTTTQQLPSKATKATFITNKLQNMLQQRSNAQCIESDDAEIETLPGQISSETKSRYFRKNPVSVQITDIQNIGSHSADMAQQSTNAHNGMNHDTSKEAQTEESVMSVNMTQNPVSITAVMQPQVNYKLKTLKAKRNHMVPDLNKNTHNSENTQEHHPEEPVGKKRKIYSIAAKSVHSVKSELFKCSRCEAVFKKEVILKKHIQLHNKNTK